MQSEPPRQFLTKVTSRSRKSLIPAITGFVRHVALKEGLDEEVAARLEEATEEAILNVILHAYEGRETETFDLILARPPGQFVVAVEDHGLPFDWERASRDGSKIGALLMKAFTDRVRFVNLGKRGKRLELVHSFRRPAEEEPPEAEPAPEPPSAPKDAPLELRQMRPEDAIGLERCVYRVYGYTYADALYHPRAVSESLEQGLMTSMVALNEDGEVVGHTGVVKESADAAVGELARGVVDPRYRGHGLFERLGAGTMELAKRQGMVGLFADAVTVHPYTQKVMRHSEGIETGVLLGFIPSSCDFRGISEERAARFPTMLYYLKLNREPHRTVFLPTRHRPVLEEVYGKLGLDRSYGEDLGARAALPQETHVELSVEPDVQTGTIAVYHPGEDASDLVRRQLRALCMQRIEEIFLDLPLCDPATPLLCAAAEEMGFFFGGLIPELREGDVLRLQYLNNAEAGGDESNMLTDFGKRLYRYVRTCQSEADRARGA